MNPQIAKNLHNKPERIARMETDARGYPIPFVVMRDGTGRPHFVVNDAHRVRQAIAEHRCGLCGEQMALDDTYFVGGPSCLYHPAGVYRDPPGHRDCLAYALSVCPYLVLPSYATHSDGLKDAAYAAIRGLGMIVEDDNAEPDRPDEFALFRCKGYVPVKDGPQSQFFLPSKNTDRIERWVDGRLAEAMVGNHLHAQIVERGSRMLAESGHTADDLAPYQVASFVGQLDGKWPWGDEGVDHMPMITKTVPGIQDALGVLRGAS